MGKHSKDVRDVPGGGYHVKGPITDRMLRSPEALAREEGNDRESTGSNDRHGKR